MKTITVDDVLAIHDDVLAGAGGGKPGVLDIGRVEAAVARMSAGFGPVELYTDLFGKAAALLEALIADHGFVDGNKRTAMASAGAFLESNAYRLDYSPGDVVAFTLGVATHEIELGEIVEWLKEHSEPVI